MLFRSVSGAQNFSTSKVGEPFSLFGDNGSGNYFHSTKDKLIDWNPPKFGTYTIIAKPAKAGVFGDAVTITITFVK